MVRRLSGTRAGAERGTSGLATRGNLRLAALALAGAAVLGACSSTVDTAQVEEDISASYEEQVGEAPSEVSCPDELAAEKGETMTCELTAGEEVIEVTVTVTKVDGEDVEYEIEPAE